MPARLPWLQAPRTPWLDLPSCYKEPGFTDVHCIVLAFVWALRIWGFELRSSHLHAYSLSQRPILPYVAFVKYFVTAIRKVIYTEPFHRLGQAHSPSIFLLSHKTSFLPSSPATQRPSLQRGRVLRLISATSTISTAKQVCPLKLHVIECATESSHILKHSP